jgi:predicted RecA/RadA family phage recombinase
MLNHRGNLDDGRIEVTAAAARTAGVPVIEQGWVGIPEVNAASGEKYTLRIKGIFEITDPGGAAAKGGEVYLTAADNTISLTAGAGKRLIGRVYRLDDEPGVPAGKMWFLLHSNQPATA